MSQTKSQEQGAAPAKPRVRKNWEWFWRVVAGLMLLVISWMVWVLYQITPRSVVTPLAYASQVRHVSTLPPALAEPAAPAPQPAGTEPAQAATGAEVSASAADMQAGARKMGTEQTRLEGLRLATEISIPQAEQQKTVQESKPGGAVANPAAAGAAGAAAKGRP